MYTARMRFEPRVLSTALLLAALSLVATAQTPVSTPRPTPPPRQQEPAAPDSAEGEIELNSDLVLVSAVVTKGGNSSKAIRNLRAADFTILDEGVPQEIAFFGGEALPLDVIFLFDASESLQFRQTFQREALAAFLQTLLRPDDRAAIFWFNDKIHVEQSFTSTAGPLLSAIDRIPSGGATALYDAIVRASADMRERSGRRAIVILSDGRDTFSSRRLHEALQSAQIADTVVYAINTSYAGWAVTDAYRRNDPLEYLASETGGEVFYTSGRDDVDKTLSLLSSRLRERYLLGFYPSTAGEGGRYRRLTVTTKRKDVRVLVRSGYYSR